MVQYYSESKPMMTNLTVLFIHEMNPQAYSYSSKGSHLGLITHFPNTCRIPNVHTFSRTTCFLSLPTSYSLLSIVALCWVHFIHFHIENDWSIPSSITRQLVIFDSLLVCLVMSLKLNKNYLLHPLQKVLDSVSFKYLNMLLEV